MTHAADFLRPSGATGVLQTGGHQAGESRRAGELQAKLDVPASTLSHHIDRLARTGLLAARRDGTYIYYSAALRALTDYLWEDCCKGGKSSCC
ncbi:MAG: helix-turn-helix transcriptional regulator [Labilithrix sp.]|nr:helix-turn-helix transcriptional regulator [Labilithrix sp.]MCW5812756.1 helix-turn-helix transcriptional regulator [Labilithrix sp.]